MSIMQAVLASFAFGILITSLVASHAVYWGWGNHVGVKTHVVGYYIPGHPNQFMTDLTPEQEAEGQATWLQMDKPIGWNPHPV